jgi:MoaA/NifB/PqqE/SkfB family radical SAM enzyme
MLKIKSIEENDVVHDSFCSLPHQKIICNSDGGVSLCCHQTTQLGILAKDTDIIDIWNSELAKEIRLETDKGNLHKVCSQSGTCPYMVKETKPINSGNDGFHINPHYPTYLEICLPDKHCNVGGEIPTKDNPACIMCKRNFTTPRQEDMTEFLCEKSKSLMPYLKTLCVLGIAEPFWKDAVFNIFEKLEFSKYKHKIEFYTNTNGICFTEKIANKFLGETVHSSLAWSLDAATSETHRKIRRLDAFDLIMVNLKRWMKIKNDNHKVSIYNSINLINLNEMVQMVELASECGVNWITLLPTYNQSGETPLGELILNEKNVKLFKNESEKARKRADQLGVDLRYQNRFDFVPPSPELTQITI